MKKNIYISVPVIFFFLLLPLAAGGATPTTSPEDKPEVKCQLDFSLKSWSVFYKSGKGHGTVNCDNNQSVRVKIRAHGGGITFGKSEIINGRGTFSKVGNIDEVFGSYATSEAHAGAKKSAGAQAMTKGGVSLALSGTGKGYDLGIAFGSFKIEPVKGK